MPGKAFHSEKAKFGLIGALIGACAPVLYTLLHHGIFHNDITFSNYIMDFVLKSPGESMVTNAFILGAVFVMGAAGVLAGHIRESDARHKAELEAKNAELQKSQAELGALTENLEKKVREGQEEILEGARKLKEANAKLLRQIEIQRKIAGSVPSQLALLDSEMRYVEMNEYGARHFLGKPLSEILGRRCYEVMDGGDGVCIDECAARKAFQTGREAMHVRTTDVQGRQVTVENKSIPLRDESGEITHVLTIVTDITAKKKEEDDLRRRANRDALTGVYNKHYLDLYLENEERKNKTDKRKRGPYTIIYADLDDLKAANDTYGHEAGDILLKKTAQVFLDATRHEDIIARVGGDEFVIILPHSGPEEGEVLINRFKRQCDEWNRSKDLSERLARLSLSISYGLGASVYGTDLFDTINKADTTMYRNKKDKKATNNGGGS
jgi:diguanylate cyclase (GGDEF)-like protein/PAS domain S-box-containing protein